MEKRGQRQLASSARHKMGGGKLKVEFVLLGQTPFSIPICSFLGPIPSVMIMEMFLQSSRPAAFMVGGSVHWLSNFTVGLVFSYLEVKNCVFFLKKKL